MATPEFPSTLPGVESLSLTTDLQVLTPDEGPGALEYRRRTRVPSAVGTVTFRFLEGDFAVFNTFYVQTLLRGHKWFYLNLPSAAGIAPHLVRCLSHRKAPSKGFNYREVSMEIEIRGRRIYPGDGEAGGSGDLPDPTGWDTEAESPEGLWLFTNFNRTAATIPNV